MHSVAEKPRHRMLLLHPIQGCPKLANFYALYLHQMLTNFQTFFTVRIRTNL